MVGADTSTRGSSPTNTPPAILDDPANVRRWLQTYHPKQLDVLNSFEISLRLGRFSSRGSDAPTTHLGGNKATSSSSASSHQTYQYGRERRLITTRTVELLRAIIGPTRWKNAAQLLTLLRGLGNELHAAGGYREPAIGNMVRRIMYAVRDEADRVALAMPSNLYGGDYEHNNNTDMEKIDELTEQVSSKLNVTSASVAAGRRDSLVSILWAHPQHVTNTRGGHSRSQSGDFNDRLRSDSLGSDSGGLNGEQQSSSSIYPPHYYNQGGGDLRQSVMEAIQEMMSELEDLHKNINDQAIQHIHAGEIILTYALSKTVELVRFATKFVHFQ